MTVIDFQGGRTLSPDMLEAIRTKSYVLRPVVKVRFLHLNSFEKGVNWVRLIEYSGMKVRVDQVGSFIGDPWPCAWSIFVWSLNVNSMSHILY